MTVRVGEVEVGEMAPEFCLPNHEKVETCLKDFRGKWVVLYFYPKDNTPGCTKEACDFSDNLSEFEKLDAMVIGVSPDPVERHQKFIAKHNLRIMLLSDVDKEVLKMYSVWKQKKMYGRTYMGVERSTFIIDPEGKIARVWRKVRVKGHVAEVAKALAELTGS